MGEVVVAASASASSTAFGRFERRFPAKLLEYKTGPAMLSTARIKRDRNGILRIIAPSAVNGYGNKPSSDSVTFSSNVSTDLPLYEPQWVSFDDYLSDRPRVFRAMFPDQHRTKRLNDEEWIIEMLPIQFLLASVKPSVVMQLRCKSDGQEYPPAVPLHVPRILELEATRWDLQGLDGVHKPPQFGLSVRGVLYSDRRAGNRLSRLKGNLEMSFSMALPPFLALVPQDVIRGVAESVLKTLAERIKPEVDEGLISDFRRYGREKLMKRGAAPPSAASHS